MEAVWGWWGYLGEWSHHEKVLASLFHDVILSPWNTRNDVVLSREGCNIPSFGPNTHRHVLIDYDDYLDVLFLYWEKEPTAYEHDDLFYILGVSQLLMIYIYIYMLVCVGRGPWSTWLMRCFVLSEELWSTCVIDVFVEREALEHMSIIFVLSMKL